jgi:DNA-binding MarR family transcriptional regulator
MKKTVPSTSPQVVNHPPPLELGALQHLLGYQIALASIPTTSLFKRFITAEFGFNKLEFTILMLLEANAEVSPKRLSHLLNIPAPNLTLVLDKLQGRHLLVRSQNASDRRVMLLGLTREGRAAVKKMRAVADNMEKEWLKFISPAERAMLFELLKKVAAHRRV